MKLMTYSIWPEIIKKKNILDNYTRFYPRTCVKELVGPLSYSTLIQAKDACSSDKTCTGIKMTIEEKPFYLCHGTIYKDNKEHKPEKYQIYKKEIQYGKQ